MKLLKETSTLAPQASDSVHVVSQLAAAAHQSKTPVRKLNAAKWRTLNELNHRWGERFRVDIPIHLSIQALAGIEARLTDLSLSGALLSSAFDLRIHSLIEVSILGSTGPRSPPVKAYVTRRRGEGAGIEWCEFAHPVIKEMLREPAVRSVSGSQAYW